MTDHRAEIVIPVDPWAGWPNSLQSHYDPQPLHGITFCTYELLGGGRQLLYVGATKNPVTRLRTHAREKTWWREVWSIRITPHTSFGAALAHEDHVIESDAPAYNKTGPRHRFTKSVQRRGLPDLIETVTGRLGMP